MSFIVIIVCANIFWINFCLTSSSPSDPGRNFKRQLFLFGILFLFNLFVGKHNCIFSNQISLSWSAERAHGLYYTLLKILHNVFIVSWNFVLYKKLSTNRLNRLCYRWYRKNILNCKRKTIEMNFWEQQSSAWGLTGLAGYRLAPAGHHIEVSEQNEFAGGLVSAIRAGKKNSWPVLSSYICPGFRSDFSFQKN